MRRGAMFLVVLSILAVAQLSQARPAAAETWCGADGARQDRKPDAVAGYQVHVIYAVPSDQPEHFYATTSLIATDVAAVDAWWRREDPTRTVRFDLAAFPCATIFGALDISYVRLPRDTSVYGPSGGRDNRSLAEDLASIGFTDPAKKYLVYYDGPTTEPYCGFSPVLPDRGGAYANSVVLIRTSANCGVLGAGLASYPAKAAAHELVHSFGAVQIDAPHACRTDGHICGDVADLMTSTPGFGALTNFVLDVGHDDYYDHPGSWWDVRDSKWLIRRDVATYELTIGTLGSGTGDVVSDVPGMSCPQFSCTKLWEAGSALQLTATPGVGSLFAGWSGACSGAAACSLKVDGPTNVTARFDKAVFLTAAIDQSKGYVGGSIRSDPTGILCPAPSCVNAFAQGTTVKLVAVPWSGYRVDSWGGACEDHAQECTVTLDASKTVTVSFGLASRQLNLSVQGHGQVSSADTGSTCATRCAWTIDVDASITLVAKPATGWRFTSWSGSCQGRTVTCSVDMTADISSSALFTKVPAPKCRPNQKSTKTKPCRK